ncbi:hypothetical protein AX16_002765 [Volvariella volvacea WC 439]|nr:hypothetical protein AX16_002765 [Volvariella volvacea WC 439]
MTGFGLDILSDEFISLAFLDAFSPMSQIWSTSEFRRIFPSVQDSGFAALSKRFGGDSYFDFNAIPFNVSTGGVLPANLAEIPSVLSLDSVLPVNILTGIPNHYLPSFSRNYVLTQQGLTAKVTCKQQNLSAETDPPLIERMEPSKLGNDSIIYTRVETSCDGITVNSSQ